MAVRGAPQAGGRHPNENLHRDGDDSEYDTCRIGEEADSTPAENRKPEIRRRAEDNQGKSCGHPSFASPYDLSAILLVTHLFHPVEDFALELFLDGYVRHGRGGRSTMPVLLAGREPHHVARPDLFNRPAPALRPAAAGRHNQMLTKRVGMPCGPSTRLESNAGALY